MLVLSWVWKWSHWNQCTTCAPREVKGHACGIEVGVQVQALLKMHYMATKKGGKRGLTGPMSCVRVLRIGVWLSALYKATTIEAAEGHTKKGKR